jgi:hypothetical protein
LITDYEPWKTTQGIGGIKPMSVFDGLPAIKVNYLAMNVATQMSICDECGAIIDYKLKDQHTKSHEDTSLLGEGMLQLMEAVVNLEEKMGINTLDDPLSLQTQLKQLREVIAVMKAEYEKQGVAFPS